MEEETEERTEVFQPSVVGNGLRAQDIVARDKLDEEMGFFRYVEGPARLGWLTNMHEASLFRCHSIA